MHVSRHSLIYGLSYALDIAGKNNLSHSKSTAYIAVAIGRELGMSEPAILKLYYASLLHDIALSNTYDIEKHCIDGEKMLSKLPLSKTIAKAVRYHHEYYDGSGAFGISGKEIPLDALIIRFASDFDDTFGKHVDQFEICLYIIVCEWLEMQTPLFPEKITSAFARLIKRETFLLDYFNTETKYALSKKLVIDDDVFYGYFDVVKFAHCFADIIDCKSTFTHTHSNGIANLARRAAKIKGYDIETQHKMYIAGLLHDIGKLDVSSDILHKDGPLTPEERFEINKHTYYTRKILEQIEGFEDIVSYASNHHEKIDGTGYPNRIEGEKLSELEKIMAICDIFQALTEERPYRKTLPPEKVWAIIEDMVANGHLDSKLVADMKPNLYKEKPPEPKKPSLMQQSIFITRKD